MSLAQGFHWSYQNLKFTGYSVAGVTTSIVFSEADACFDVAQGLPFQFNINNILITHGHMDHAAGLPYLIAQKAMLSQKPPLIYMPPSLCQPMTQIMKVWTSIEDHTYAYSFLPATLDQEFALRAPYFFKAFATHHRVPSNGYIVYERKKRLKPELQGLTQKELIEIKKTGQDPNEYSSEPIVAFTGDTKIEFIESHPDVRRAKILFMEVTFWDQKKDVANARHWGHIHLDEFIPALEKLKNEKIVLIHASARYSTKQLLEIIDARIPEQHKTRLSLFPRPM